MIGHWMIMMQAKGITYLSFHSIHYTLGSIWIKFVQKKNVKYLSLPLGLSHFSISISFLFLSCFLISHSPFSLSSLSFALFYTLSDLFSLSFSISLALSLSNCITLFLQITLPPLLSLPNSLSYLSTYNTLSLTLISTPYDGIFLLFHLSCVLSIVRECNATQGLQYKTLQILNVQFPQ